MLDKQQLRSDGGLSRFHKQMFWGGREQRNGKKKQRSKRLRALRRVSMPGELAEELYVEDRKLKGKFSIKDIKDVVL